MMSGEARAARIYRPLAILLAITSTSFFSECRDDATSPENRPPTILDVTANPDSVETKGLAELRCRADDADGDSIIFTWVTGDGRFPSGATGETVVWEAPAYTGSFSIRVDVGDEETTVTDSVSIVVVECLVNQSPSIPSNPFPSDDATARADAELGLRGSRRR